jgi:hypothetical protein
MWWLCTSLVPVLNNTMKHVVLLLGTTCCEARFHHDDDTDNDNSGYNNNDDDSNFPVDELSVNRIGPPKSLPLLSIIRLKIPSLRSGIKIKPRKQPALQTTILTLQAMVLSGC